LDPITEDRFDALLVEKLDQRKWWGETAAGLEAIDEEADIGGTLTEAGLVTSADLKTVANLELGPAGRSLPIPARQDAEERIRLLTAGFVRSAVGELAVPYLLGRDDA
jgi:hypothetical protein